jgi:hypothetical protein
MSWSGSRALLVAGISVACVYGSGARAQSSDGQKPAPPPAQQQGGSGSQDAGKQGGGNPFPGDTTNVPVMPSKENPNPPSPPGAGTGQDARQNPGQGSGSGQGASGGGSNQFPGDTGDVPVMPSKGTPALPEGTYRGDSYVGLPNDDADPVKSPEDPVAESSADRQGFSSSNIPGLDKILDQPDSEDQQAAKKKGRGGDKYGERPAEHKETPGEDIEVGKFELERKNWKAALSRFESALALSPEDPEVYWGLAESERGLGQFAEARANYKKLLDYDPDGPHGKAARKALNDPQIANAQAAGPVAVDSAKK